MVSLIHSSSIQAAAVASNLFCTCYKFNMQVENATVLLLLAEIHKVRYEYSLYQFLSENLRIKLSFLFLLSEIRRCCIRAVLCISKLVILQNI